MDAPATSSLSDPWISTTLWRAAWPKAAGLDLLEHQFVPLDLAIDSTLPQKQKLAEAMRYALSRREALSVYIDDGRVGIDNNIAERAMRPIGIGRKNWLFAGSDKGGERIANILTIIETAKMNGHNPETYLTAVLTLIQDYGHDRLEELRPWNMPVEETIRQGQH